MPSVLIGAGPIRNQPGEFRDRLVAAGFRPIDLPGLAPLTEAQFLEYLPQCDAIIAGGERISPEAIAASPNLRVIARTGVGYDGVPLAPASQRKIAVTITPGTNHESVAEQAFGLMLAVLRRIALNDRLIREGRWDRTVVLPIRGKTLGLVGLGRIGKAMVPRAKAFGMSVLVCEPLADEAFLAEWGIRAVSLPELLAQSDVVSLHLPLIEATRGLFHAEIFRHMKPGAIFLNTARGGLVIEEDLYEAIASGRLGGAGLDVFDPEPPAPSNPLLQLPNVVSAPHMGGVDAKSMDDMATLAAQCIIDLHLGLWPAECVVNPEIADGWRW